MLNSYAKTLISWDNPILDDRTYRQTSWLPMNRFNEHQDYPGFRLGSLGVPSESGEGITHVIIATISRQFRMIEDGMKSISMLTKRGCTWDMLGTLHWMRNWQWESWSRRPIQEIQWVISWLYPDVKPAQNECRARMQDVESKKVPIAYSKSMEVLIRERTICHMPPLGQKKTIAHLSMSSFLQFFNFINSKHDRRILTHIILHNTVAHHFHRPPVLHTSSLKSVPPLLWSQWAKKPGHGAQVHFCNQCALHHWLPGTCWADPKWLGGSETLPFLGGFW